MSQKGKVQQRHRSRWRRHEIRSIAPAVGRSHRHPRKIAGLDAGVAVVLMVVLVRPGGEAEKCEILRAEPFPQLLVRSQYHGGLAARLNQQIGLVISVETR